MCFECTHAYSIVYGLNHVLTAYATQLVTREGHLVVTLVDVLLERRFRVRDDLPQCHELLAYLLRGGWGTVRLY